MRHMVEISGSQLYIIIWNSEEKLFLKYKFGKLRVSMVFKETLLVEITQENKSRERSIKRP